MSIYLHIPFCRRKCFYCDFNSYVTDSSVRGEYVHALLTEIRWWGRALASARGVAKTAESLYLGGGTPSLLTSDQLETLLRACATELSVAPDAEVTIEANPESATAHWLQSVRTLGYNRLSVGIQSFDDRLLATLGRLHSAGDALRCFDDARKAGFENVSIDLMFGLDGQSLDTWRASLETAIRSAPEHVSLYGLTVEEGTPLAGKVRKGAYVPVLPDSAAEMYELAEELLGGAGYEHYELSNWAKPGRRSRHNLSYWTSGPYLGCGAGAHGRLGAYRFWSVKKPRAYIDAWRQYDASSWERGQDARAKSAVAHIPILGPRASSPAAPVAGEDARGPRRAPHASLARAGCPRSQEEASHVSPNPFGLPEGVIEDWEELSPGTRRQESIMLGLRLAEGISMEEFRRQTGQSLEDLAEPALDELRGAGLLVLVDGSLRATARGRLLLDEVLARLFAAIESEESKREGES